MFWLICIVDKIYYITLSLKKYEALGDKIIVTRIIRNDGSDSSKPESTVSSKIIHIYTIQMVLPVTWVPGLPRGGHPASSRNMVKLVVGLLYTSGLTDRYLNKILQVLQHLFFNLLILYKDLTFYFNYLIHEYCIILSTAWHLSMKVVIMYVTWQIWL